MFKIFTLYISLFFIIMSNFAITSNNPIECSICEHSIKEKEYLVDIWGNPFHIKHKNEGKFCESCSRIISRKITKGGYQLNDGRHICSLCDVSIIKKSMINLYKLIDFLHFFELSNLIKSSLTQIF